MLPHLYKPTRAPKIRPCCERVSVLVHKEFEVATEMWAKIGTEIPRAIGIRSV
jgi:hypothetical protein